MRKYCVITLRSVFVQGIRVLDTLSPYIYYELLLICIHIIIHLYHGYYGKCDPAWENSAYVHMKFDHFFRI